jgi:hypothetical protein
MASDQDRQRVEKRFKQEERAKDGRMAMIEYEVQALPVREKIARLKALRLAKEAQEPGREVEARPAIEIKVLYG